ncbi:MAG: glycosyltransferase family 2 protein [Pseudomonadota bacterium]|nr:glycosyltransferase family 2 protein [Pseudomonadota bacterium]MDE3037275.1 glycosyltransferase family 2 protein [Pseudomonadota bacterium]
MVKLSVIVPVYNEEKTLRRCVERVLAIADSETTLEIIIVDDASTDRTAEVARVLAKNHGIKLLSHAMNQGKSAALRTGFRSAAGDIVAVQDADLEYDPADLKKLIKPIVDGKADVTIGSRFMAGRQRKGGYFWNGIANKSITLWSNLFSGLHLSDVETCYKVFRREVIQSITIEEDRFGFDPEIIAKIARLRLNGQPLRIREIAISYVGRTVEEGKKITWKDGIRALYAIVRYSFYPCWNIQI